MTLLSTCIGAALSRGLEALIRTTEARTDSCAQPVANPHLFFVALLEGAESGGPPTPSGSEWSHDGIVGGMGASG